MLLLLLLHLRVTGTSEHWHQITTIATASKQHTHRLLLLMMMHTVATAADSHCVAEQIEPQKRKQSCREEISQREREKTITE